MGENEMKKFGLLSTSAISSAALFGLSAIFATPALAQNADGTPCTQAQRDAGTCTDQAPSTASPAADSGSIVVTGSRIRRPNLESTVPITSLAGDQLFQQGDTNIGETLNELPQLRSTFAQQNPGLGIGIAGLNLLDLRGLGTQRTLVLVNGRRHVPGDILNNAVSVDVNSIPNDLIERIDIVTGGNSAIYGSDAIAGVVNFVLRRDYEGLQIRGNAAMTDRGYAGNQYVSAMYGMNFSDGRGNVTVHGEYAHQERVFASDIDWFRVNNGFGAVDADTGGCFANGTPAGCLVGGSDGFPDQILIHDIRSASIHFAGLIPVTQRTTTPGCGTGTLANNGGPNSLGNPYNCTYVFTAAGQLVPQTGARYGTGIIGGISGGNGQTGREGHTLSVLPYLERMNFNLLGHYTFSDAAELFVEAKYNETSAQGNNAGPSFIQGTGTFDFRERPRIDNPFLGAANRTLLSTAIINSGCNTSLTVACGTGNLTAAQITTINNGTYRFALARNLLDVGLRDEHFERQTIRLVGGLRGTFNDDWTYEVSANWGQFQEAITTGGFIDRQRFMLAMDAGLDPVTNTIRCRSQFDAASAVPYTVAAGDPRIPGFASRLAADIAACVPYNPFGTADNSASVNYFAREFTAQGEITQLVFSGFVSGDSSQLFELPGGPVRFALGAEYREEQSFYSQDQYITDGFANGVSIPAFPENLFTVKELFGELQIPILRDLPFVHELTLSGAARVAEYQGNVGTVWSYNAGAEWAPIRDIRFRGNYSRAVRAPNVSETAAPLVPNFSNGFVDPCNPAQIGNNPTRAANCQADIPAAQLAALTDVTQSLGIVSGSNPNLTVETSDSWTVGAVIQPRWIPGLSLTVDYYDITVDGIISNVAVQTLVNNCYDQARPNIFCGQFTRYTGAGPGPNGEQPGRILQFSLISAPLNFAARKRRGIDVNLNYRANISTDVAVASNLIYTHNLQISNFEDPTNPTFENRVLSEIGDPVDEFRWDVDLSYRNFTFGYRMRYIGPMFVGAYESYRPLESGCTGSGATLNCPPFNTDTTEPEKYPEIFYHDLRFEWNVDNNVGPADSLQFYMGVDNVLNTRPPLNTTATGVGTAIYDIRGRNFYAGFRARF
jgi:outer membrane receptor protein involved in Fe transport